MSLRIAVSILAAVTTAGMAVVTAACAADSPAVGPRVSTTDSAGIQVVEVSGLDLGALPEWRLGAEPLVRIGEVEGPETHVFGRIAAGGLLPGGEVVLLDGQEMWVGVYDTDGAFVRRMGGPGNGPGELRAAGELRVTGPHAFALVDWRLSRVTAFDVSTGAAETREVSLRSCPLPILPDAYPSCGVDGVLADGQLLLVGGLPLSESTQFSSFRIEEVEPRRRLLGLAGGEAVVVLDTVHMEAWTNVHSPEAIWFFATPFRMTEAWAAGDDRVIVVRNEPFELRAWSADGTLDRIVRFDTHPASRVAEHSAALEVAIQAGDNDLLKRYLAEVAWAATVPHFRTVLIDAVGRTWLEDYWPDIDGLGAPAPSWWTVLDTIGVPAARVQAPVAEDILMIGEDRMLVRETDELGVHRAAVFTIEDGGAGPQS